MKKLIFIIFALFFTFSAFSQREFNIPIHANKGLRVGENGPVIDSFQIVGDTILYIYSGNIRFPINYDSPITQPDEISGLILWLDASDASTITTTNDSVSVWADKSGGGHDAVSISNNTRPIYVSPEYIKFTRLPNTYLSTDTLTSNYNQYEIFMSYKQYNGSYFRLLFNGFNSSEDFRIVTANDSVAVYLGSDYFNIDKSDTLHHIIDFVNDNINSNGVWYDGNYIGSPSGAKIYNGLFINGHYNKDYISEQKIFEIIVYNRKLTNNERNAIYEYLKKKAGL